MALRTINVSELNSLRNGTKTYNKRIMSKSELDKLRKTAKESKYEIKTADGSKIGDVSYDAYRAIECDTLNSYTPKNDDEKKVLEEYKKYIRSFTDPYVKQEIQNIQDLQIVGGKANKEKLEKDENRKNETKKVGSATRVIATNKRSNGLTTQTQREESKRAEKTIQKYREKKEKDNKNTTINNIKKAANSGAYLLTKTSAGATGAAENVIKLIEAAPDWTLSKITGLFGFDEASNWFKNNVGEILDRETEGEKTSKYADYQYSPSPGLRFAGDVFESAGAMLPSIAAEMATAGASPMLETEAVKFGTKLAKGGKLSKTAERLNTTKIARIAKTMKKPSSILFGAGAAGANASQAYRETGDVDKSLMYGGLSGLAEVATEQIFGGFAGTDIGDSFIDFPINNKVLRKTMNLFTEGAEEMIMTAADPAFKRVSKVDENASIAPFEEFVQSGISGVLLSVLMGAATFPVTRSERVKAVNTLNTITNGINSIIVDENQKIKPLSNNATVEEIEMQQGKIENVANQFAKQTVIEEMARKNTENSTQEPNQAPSGSNVADNAQETTVKTTNDNTAPVNNNAQNPVSATNTTGEVSNTAEQKTFAETSKNSAEQTVTEKREQPALNVGDKFRDKRNGAVITVIGRDENNTVITEDNTGVTKTYLNEAADLITINNNYEQIARGNVETEQPGQAVTEFNAPKSITLTKVGDFYEAYGDEAIELADKLKLTPTTKMVNGASVQMVGFPAYALDNYKNILGSNYNITVADTPIVTSNTQNGVENKVLQNAAGNDIIGVNNSIGEVRGNVNIRGNQTEDSEQATFDNSGMLDFNGESANKLSAEEQTDEVQERTSGIYDQSRSLYGGREESVERRTLEDVCELESFIKLEEFVGKEISIKLSNGLFEKYKNDPRLNDGYEIRDLYTYDMLSDPNNELRELFADNIAEYFNDNKSTDVDITGKEVSAETLNATKNSVVKNEEGQLIPLYHATDKEFSAFRASDIGIHFGSYSQAAQRAQDKNINSPIFIKAYLNIENPLVIDEDFFGWNSFQIVQKLSAIGVITNEQANEFFEKSKVDLKESNKELAELLQSKGYDGIIYNNEIEAVGGKSYIVFDNSQIFRADGQTNAEQAVTETPVKVKNTSDNEGVTNIDVDMAEGEILSLKHTKNVYSVFKDAKKVVIGDGIITDGRFGLPLTDANLEAVKKVYDGEITEMQNLKMSKFYNPDNDVIIQGNPIVDDTTEMTFYVFTIDGKYYVAQQKYIDAVNKKGYVIKANSQSVAIPWTVHDSEGNLIAILCGATPNKNADVVYNNKQTVKEILEMNRQKKEAKAAEKAEADRRNAEFEESAAQKRNAELERRKSLSTPEEINYLKEKYEGKEFTDGENTYRVIYHPDRAWFEFAIVQEDGSLEHFGAELIEPSSAAMEQKISLLEKFRQNNVKNKELARIEEEKRAEAQAKKDEEEKHINSYVSGMKPMTAAKIKNTLLKDFYADVKLHKFIENAVKNGQRLEAKDINGKKSYRLYKDGSLYYEINKTAYDYGKYIESILKDAESGIKSDKTVTETPESVTEPTESVIKKADSVTEVPENENAVPYTDKEKQNWENSKDIIVYESDEQFESFVEKVLKNEDTHKKIYFGKVPDTTAQMVLDKTGVDVSGHNIALKGYEIRKILLNSHGDEKVEAARGQEPITTDDLKNIPSVITNPDDVSLSEKEYEGKPALLFEKTIDGKNYVVAYVSRKHHDIAIQTMYKKRSLATAENADALSSTPETTSSTASNNIVPQDNDIVNSSVRNNGKNDTLNLTDKCELIATKHTATGDDIWVVTLKDRLSSDEYKDLSGKVKAVGGYYSRFAKTPDGKAIPGFIFKSKPDADVINTFNGFFGMEAAEEAAPTETKSSVKEIGTEALLGAVGNAKVGDEIKLSDYEKAEADEQGLNNQPESDTMVSEKTKEDFKVGDIIDVNGKQWRVTSTDFTMTFENLDKNDSEATFQHIGGMDSFKNTHDYTVIKESAENVHDRILGRESRNDNAVRESEPVSEVEEERNTGTADRKLGEDVASKNGKNIQSSETEASATGQLDSGDNNNRVRESDSSNGNSGTGTDGNDNVDVAENSSKPKDFVITKAVAEDIDKSAPSMADNIKAIETLHAIEKSGKAPTKTQQGLLAKFKGWGGLAGSFFGSNRTKLQELMSESELKAAQSTVNDAYFTPTGIIDGIYKALSHLGFEGGNILEPSMGIGNFFGRMPKTVKDKSSLFGVEIDSISGRIAQQLYPSANIEIAPFQDVAYKDGAFDLIIGNVPFGEVKYNYKGKKYLIHDYFFVKAMDKLNDGGILMFLTTKGTLDKLDSTTRTELSNHGKLLGAYRLPSDVFTKSAGASVVTDLIIMQKSSDTNGESFINLGTVAAGIGEFSVNEYFVNHPENVIGRFTSRKDWRSGKEVLDVVATGNVAEQLVKAIRKLPKNLLSGVQTVGSVNVTENNAPVQTFTVTENDTVEYIDAATGDVKQIKGKSAKIAKDYVALKDTYQELVDSTLNDYETDYIESKRKALNTAYDSFVKKHGALEDNKKLLSADNDFYKMSGLEVYDTKTKKIVKSEMFTKDTLGKRKPKKADSVLDALSISIGETGGVDVNRIADLTGVSESEAIKQLDDRIVYTPDGIYELNEVYLSGNVREKYDAVKGKKGFEKNEKMLEAVIPADIPAKDITPQFGSPWIKPDYVADFLKETLHLYNKPVVSYDPTSGTWSISGNTWGDNTLLTNKYGTKYMDAVKIAEKALNMRRIVVTDKDTKKMLVGETRAAQQKAEDIKAAFEEWCFKDADRRKDLVATFNRKFNSNKNMDFSELAKYLTFDGLTDTFKLRDYQKRAVARAVFNGNTLLAHGVGTGKTAEMIAIAMELKRMGIAKKNMMVVPNHKVADFRNDILKMYPSAKVAYLEKGANPEQRQRFYALVASNDFDIVVIPHSSFEMLDVSSDTKKAFINNQISELEEVLTAAQAEKGKIDGRFIRNLENQKKRLEDRLKFITESAKDNGNVFEELGVDSLFVDEAHNFKNLPFYSKLSRVAGVSINQPNNKTRASRAENMFMITDYLNRNGGRITFGTATPITNSMSEIYNMTRFLRPDILADAGLQSFDAWASMFGSIVNQAEVDPSGRNMRMKERFSKFKNVSQMIEQFRRMADILKTGDVIQELPIAERIDVYSEPNEIQEEFLDIIDKMIDDIRANGQRSEHNMLSVTTAGQMAAIDLRFVASFFDGKYSIDELNLPNNRTSQVAQRVYKEYVDSDKTKGTQFVFCDKGVSDDPSKKYNFYVYGDLINKLVALGIPRNEIAVAQEFKDKADLSARVNTGEIRVLIGSTAVMGEGMNAQNKAVALHHMTVPDRPSDIEQREGRIIRFGNENKNVRIYRYIQEKSYDSYQWQMQERKAGFINQALSGGTVSELEEMSDFQLSAREAKAIASGNPLILEKIEIEDRLNNLKSIRNKFNTDKLEMQDRLAVLPNRIAKKEKAIADTTADAKTVTDNTPKDFEITLGKTKYAERAKAAEALKRGLANAPRNGTHIKIGSYRGLDLYYTSSFDKGTHFILKGSGEYSTLGGDSASGNITRITNLAEKIGETLEVDKALVANYKAEIETLKKEVDAEFPRAKELEELQAKLNDIDTQLGINVSTVDMSDVIVDDEAGSDDTESSKDLDTTDDTSRWTAERVEGSKDKGITLSDIIKKISEEFDIPISSGKVTDREASGIYKTQAEAIRTRISNNLPTISHELGHHLNKRYELSLLESVEEVKDIVSDEFLNKYPADKINGELVAEFVRHYLKNKNEANRRCPEFYDDFIRSLSKSDLTAINEIANLVNEYMSYDISKKYESSIVGAKKARKLQKDSVKDISDKIYTDWIYSFHPIKQLTDFVEKTVGETPQGSKSMYVLADNSLNAHTIANFVVTEGFRDLDGNILDDKKSFIECLKGIKTYNKKSVADFELYLKLKHALEINSQGKRTFADEVLENPDNMRSEIARLEKEHPEFKQTANDIYEYQYNLLKYFAVPSGLLTMQQVEYLHEKYPCYVPFYRFVEGKKGGSFARKALAKQGGLIKKLKGSGLDTLSHLESIVNNTEKIVKASLRHQTAVVLAEYADTVDGIGQFIEKVTPDMIPHSIDITALKEDFTDKLQQVIKSGEDFSAVTELLDDVFGNDVMDFTPIVNESKKIISVLRNGERSYYQIHNDELFKAVTELSPKQTSGILNMVGKMMRVTNALITQYNPVFAVSNPIRDIRTAYKLSEIDNPVKFTTSYVKSIVDIVTKSDSYKQFKAMGGGHSAELTAYIEDISKTLRRVAQKDRGKAMRIAFSLLHPIELVSSLNSFTESIPRFMEFQRVLNESGDLQKAIHAADDLTTNFKRHGASPVSKVVNTVFRFNNASLQGLDRTRRAFTDAPSNRRRKIITKWLLDAILVALFMYFYNKNVDEEGYKNLSSYKKNNFYNFAIGDGKFLSLPKERENALLNTLTERVIDKMIGDDENAFYDFGGYLSMQLLPPMFPETLNPSEIAHSYLGNTILGGFEDIGTNKDFKGTPIESAYDKYLPSNERYNESTTKLAYSLGQTKIARSLDLSPKKIDHLISTYTGILGQANKALFPMNDSRRDTTLGLRNKFISDGNYSTDVLNRMYDNQEKAEKAFNYSGTAETAIEYEQNAIITSYISGMNKAIRELPEDEQRGGRAYLLKMLNRWNYDTTESQKEIKSRLKKEKIDEDCIVTSVPESTMEWSEKKDKYTYQMTPQEYDEYIKDYLALVEQYRNYSAKKNSNQDNYTKALKETEKEVKKVLSEKYKKKYRNKATKTLKE